MKHAKVKSVPIGEHFKMLAEQSHSTAQEKEDMIGVIYSNTIGSVMYNMKCSRPYLDYAISMVNPERSHWEAVN